MAITKNPCGYSPAVTSPQVFFPHRVVRVMKRIENRNWSDTLDYSDWRDVTAVYALVWLGTHGIPPETRYGMIRTDLEPFKWDADKARDLEPHEQFGWIDCTNLHADRNGYSLSPAVDEFDMQVLHCGPEMFDSLAAFDAHVARMAEEARLQAETLEAARKAEEAKVAAKAAVKAQKDEALRIEAEKLLARIPAKGTVVTVEGFTGQVFWTGCSKYRGRWNARAGVKNSAGEVVWVSADRF
jgi:hypothetical protein